MSIKATSWVWSLEGESDENPHGLPNGTIKLVLMKHADHAHDDGTHTWQSVETVAKYALCSKRTAQRANEWLIENGYMREGDQSVIPDHYDPRRRPIAYELAMNEGTRLEWAALAAAGGSSRRQAAKAAGAKGGRASAEVRRGANLTAQDVASSGDDSRGANLAAQDANVRGDIPDQPGVTNEPSRGDTGVTQTTQVTTQINQNPSSSSAAGAADDNDDNDDYDPTGTKNDRPEIVALCKHLRNRMIENDCKRPKITKEWLDAARLMLDNDRRDAEKAHNLIDWCQNDTFWRSNILSMPKFRDQYDKLRLRAVEEWEARKPQRGYDDKATWGEAAQDTPQEDMSPEELEAFFARGRQDRPRTNG